VKIAVCSDAHTDARCCGVERFDEVARAFDEVADYAEGMPYSDLERAMFVFDGDLCDGDDGRDVLRASSLAIEHARRLAEAGIGKQLWVAGNHDVLGDGSTTLDPLAAVGDRFVVRGEPLRIDIVEDGEILAVALAFPYSPKPYDAERALAFFLEDTKTIPQRIVFTHLQLPGMHPGSESQEMARGKDRMFPIGLLKGARRCTVVAGHYHAGGVGPAGIHIVGSMCRNTFGEEENTPSFLVLDVTPNGVKVERRPFSGSTAMLTIDTLRTTSEYEACRGAFVRIDPGENCPPDVVAEMEKRAREAGALAVKVMGTRRDAVIVDADKPDLSAQQMERRSPREVVMAMTAEAVSRDRGALREFVESVADEAKL
jgi:hypothetical protein